MGTIVRIVLYARDRTAGEDASAAAFARIAALDGTLSDYRDTSEAMRLSRASGGGAVAVSGDLFRVLQAAQALARASDGAFDVTTGPLTILWRAARRHRALPDPAALATARARVGYAKVELDERRRSVRLREPGMQLDFGGIAKGFAADEAIAVLGRRGIPRALVACGGDVVAAGAPPGQDGWRVAIAGLDTEANGFAMLRRAAVSTSGDAEQFVELDGVRYSHIIDPRTGQPLTGRSSVTVVARNGVSSDSLATAVSVMGPEAGLALVDATPGASARITRLDGGPRVYRSARWREE